MTCSPSKKALWFWRIMLLLYLAAVAYICFGHAENLPKVKEWHFFVPFDKFVHYFLFFPFPVLAFLSLKKKRVLDWKSGLLVLGAFALGCAIAGSTELIQGMTSYRSKDVMDFVADVSGMATSSILLLVSLLFYGIRGTR